MHIILLNIVVGILLYMACLFIFFLNEKKLGKNRRNKNDDGDDDGGGLPVSFPPDFDLPPGVCLPDDPRLEKVKEHEEVLA